MKTVAVEDTTLTAEDLARLAEKEPIIPDPQRTAVGRGEGLVWVGLGVRFVGEQSEVHRHNRRLRRSYREQGGISMDEIRTEFGLKHKETPAKRQGSRKT